jgi:hypothetical protein
MVLNVLVWMATAFSGAALADCHLVTATVWNSSTTVVPGELPGLTDATSTERRGFGFFIHEDADGNCRWEHWDIGDHDGDHRNDDTQEEMEDYVDAYLDWMGRDWRRAGKVATSAFFLGLTLAVSATGYCCLSHYKWIRYLTGILGLAVLMPIQFGIFTAMDSDFCTNRDCTVSRSGYFAILAGFLYLAGSIMFFFLHNYPGQVHEQSNVVVTNVAEDGNDVTQSDVENNVIVREVDYAVDYESTPHVVVANGDGNHGTSNGVHDGLSDAQEIKPAQIY